MKKTQKYSQFLLNLIIMAALCFGSQYSVAAQAPVQAAIEDVFPPLFSGLAWENLGNIQKDVRVYDQTLVLNGDMFKAVKGFQSEIPENIFDYYSTENLLSLGWNFAGNTGFESTYWHSSGKYLIVQIMECPDSGTDYCVNIWQSVESSSALPLIAEPFAAPVVALASFSKTTPANGATVALPADTYRFLTWGDASIGSTDRYQYCIDGTNNQLCDTDWKTRNSLYSGGPNDFTVVAGNTYYWQVRVRDAGTYANSGTWWSFTIQTNSSTGPTVSSIVRANPSSSTTNAASVSFTVIFSQSVTGVDISDFTLVTAGVVGSSISGVSGSGSVYTVTVSTGTGDGIIRLDVADNDSIINSSSTPLGGAGTGNGNFTNGPSYVIDRTPPTVISSVPSATATPGLINFTVTFSESVTGVDVNDFALVTTGNVTGVLITTVSGTGLTRTVTVNTGGVGSGTIRLNVVDNDSILDAASISLGGAGAGNGNFSSGTVYNKPTFSDVPASHWAWKHIEGVYVVGITSGCSSSGYCPDAPVTRAQMAVFLLKTKSGAAYVPPVVGSTTGFSDVATSYWAAAWIKALAEAGITSGCGIGIYCPDASVTRAQMAVFLLKTKYGLAYTPPVLGSTTGFNDVAVDYWAASWIKALADLGITSGCSSGMYCPEASVTRAEMAVFLVKTFNISMP